VAEGGSGVSLGCGVAEGGMGEAVGGTVGCGVADGGVGLSSVNFGAQAARAPKNAAAAILKKLRRLR